MQVTRLWNLLIIVLAQYFTAFFLFDINVFTNKRLFLLSLSCVFIAAAGYIINDYYDIKIDLINKPNRVVVGRILKRRVAIFWHSALNITGIGIGFLLSWQIGVINFLCAVLLWLYSNQLKRIAFVGNFSVALLAAISIFSLNLLFQENNLLVVAYAMFAFGFTLIREIIKDMEDMKGDSTFGCKTLPVVLGMRGTKYIIYLLSALFVSSLSVLAYLFVGDGLTKFCLTLVVPLGILIFFLHRADTVHHFNQLSNYCKIVMLLGIFSMMIY